MFPSLVLTLFTKRGHYGYIITNNMLQFPLYEILIIFVKHEGGGGAEWVSLLQCYALN